jgi:hypothetical protein
MRHHSSQHPNIGFLVADVAELGDAARTIEAATSPPRAACTKTRAARLPIAKGGIASARRLGLRIRLESAPP